MRWLQLRIDRRSTPVRLQFTTLQPLYDIHYSAAYIDITK